jgi:hypothetical protein
MASNSDNKVFALLLALILVVLIVLVHRLAFHYQAHAHDMEQAHGNVELERVYRFYDSWMRLPDRRYSCCSKTDCHDVEVRQDPEGGWQFLDKSQNLWRHIPEAILEHNAADGRESPDGKNHVCYNTMYVFCAVLGSQG